jgi:UDP-glucuronate 4-epimerase
MLWAKSSKELHASDMPATFADIDSLKEEVGFKPDTDIDMQQFVA